MRKQIFLIFIFMPAIVFASGGESTSWKSIRENAKGSEALKNNNYQQAQDHFIQALKGTPFSPELQVNLGLSYHGQGQMEKAESTYKSALEIAQSPEARFTALFNLGEMAGKAKKYDEALSYYQGALALNPQSKEVKTNIELLIQQQQQGGGGGQDKKDQDKDQKENQDQKGQGQDQKDKKDDQGDKEDKPKEYGKNKPQPKKFDSKELTQSDVNKILGEIKQQEQKIRAEYNKKDVKEKPRDKDW